MWRLWQSVSRLPQGHHRTSCSNSDCSCTLRRSRVLELSVSSWCNLSARLVLEGTASAGKGLMVLVICRILFNPPSYAFCQLRSVVSCCRSFSWLWKTSWEPLQPLVLTPGTSGTLRRLPLTTSKETELLGGSGGVVNSLDFYPASLKYLGRFYFRCILSSQWKAVTVNLWSLRCQLERHFWMPIVRMCLAAITCCLCYRMPKNIFLH